MPGERSGFEEMLTGNQKLNKRWLHLQGFQAFYVTEANVNINNSDGRTEPGF